MRVVGVKFVVRPNALVLMAWVVAATAWRLSLGQWSWRDLAAASTLLAAQPFGEWFVHRYLMHRGQLHIGGHHLSLPLHDEHAKHHRDPSVEHFMPMPIVVAVAAATTFLATVVIPSRPVAATVVVVLATELLAYVWVHYLLHADHEPTSRWFRAQRTAHLRHHATREDRDYGVITPIADIVLRTR